MCEAEGGSETAWLNHFAHMIPGWGIRQKACAQHLLTQLSVTHAQVCVGVSVCFSLDTCFLSHLSFLKIINIRHLAQKADYTAPAHICKKRHKTECKTCGRSDMKEINNHFFDHLKACS